MRLLITALTVGFVLTAASTSTADAQARQRCAGHAIVGLAAVTAVVGVGDAYEQGWKTRNVALIGSSAALFALGIGLAAPTYGPFDAPTEFVRARCHYRTLTIAGGLSLAAATLFGTMVARAPSVGDAFGLVAATIVVGIVGIILTSVGAARLANLEEPGSTTSPLLDFSF